MQLKDEFLALRKQYILKQFSHLNRMQQKAVVTGNGAILILAGAGSGKTTVLVNRIEYLIGFGDGYHSDEVYGKVGEAELGCLKSALAQGGSVQEIAPLLSVGRVRPYQILAITFTNKAARELKERIAAKLQAEENQVNACTFHSLCMRILRVHGDLLGYTNAFTIYDGGDQTRVMKEIYKTFQVDDKMMPIKSTLSMISGFKNDFMLPEEYKKQEFTEYKKKLIGEIYSKYQEVLKKSNAMDFDDLIINTVCLFQEHPQVLDKYQERYRYLLVDEYQDTNHIQYMLVSMLAEKYKNLCVVGDDDQSIYKFRGATIENILQFEDQFPHATVIKLEQNYRSTQNILKGANGVISNNKGRKGKELWTENDTGEKIHILRLNNEREEAEFVGETIQSWVKDGGKYQQHAVLYRTNAQSNLVEQFCAKSAIPYRVFGGLRFFDRKEIKDVLGYLCVVNNPHDTLRLKRVINEPKRGVGDTTVEKAQAIADGLGIPLFEVFEHGDQYPDIKARGKVLGEFCRMIRSYGEEEKQGDLYLLVKQLLEDTGYLDSLKNQGFEGQTRLENVEEFLNNITAFVKENPQGTLNDFLEEISLVTSLDNYSQEEDSVVLMTIHAAKGLEFDRVFLIGAEEGIFPGKQSAFSAEELEEERRLCYVAITRARKQLFMSHAVTRMLYGQTSRNQPSRFLNEIHPEYILLEDKSAPIFGAKSSREGTVPPLGRGGVSASSVGSFQKKKPVTEVFLPGDVVVHKIFKVGVIKQGIPMGNDTLLTIDFEGVGVKKIMANFANLQRG